jgi:enoyl-CoA hydratase/carnithine racemase/uncharacterized protein YqeY
VTPPGIRERDDDGILVWELCDPARSNPVSPAVLRWIAARAALLDGRIVIVRGVGGRVFCGGFDLAALAEDPGDTLPDIPLGAAVDAMRAADATFVAAIDGHAVGAGVELACACDLRVARRGITFEVPAARLGVVYRADGLALLCHALGSPLVRRLVLLGERIDAELAATHGAVDVLADDDGFAAALADVVARLRRTGAAARRGNRDALRTMVPQVPAAFRAEHDLLRGQAFAAARERMSARPSAALPNPAAGGIGLRAMAIKDDIEARVKQARRDKDEVTLNVIGMLKNRVLTELKSGSGAVETDELWLSVISSYVKQLRKSIPEFERAGDRGREAIAAVEVELRFCEQFLPSKLDEAATEAIVRTLVATHGLAGQGAKATGKLMGLLMKEHRDSIDGDVAKAVVARVLAE